jgi:hypothetical protein
LEDGKNCVRERRGVALQRTLQEENVGARLVSRNTHVSAGEVGLPPISPLQINCFFGNKQFGGRYETFHMFAVGDAAELDGVILIACCPILGLLEQPEHHQ